MDPVLVITLQLVLFVDHTTILAYGPAGLAWESERLAWDDLEAVTVDGEHLHAKRLTHPETRSPPSPSTSGPDVPETHRTPTDGYVEAIDPSDADTERRSGVSLHRCSSSPRPRRSAARSHRPTPGPGPRG